MNKAQLYTTNNSEQVAAAETFFNVFGEMKIEGPMLYPT